MPTPAEFCKRCGRVRDIHWLPDYACPNGEDTFTPSLPEGYDTKEHLMELVHHCWIYSGYRDCGYDKMGLEMKALYHHCRDYMHEE